MTPLELGLLCGAGFLAGGVDAMAGGGGLVTLPSLLAVGLPPHLALGTNKAQSLVGTLAALTRYAHADLVDRPLAKSSFPLGFIGSVVGASLVLRISPEVLKPVVLGLLIAVALFLSLRRGKEVIATAPPDAKALRWAAIAALGIGTYDGFFGPGTGTFLILAFSHVLGQGFGRASANAKVVNLASNVAAVLLFSFQGKVLWRVALPMAAFNLMGGWVGAHLAVKGGDRLVRKAVLVVVVALVVKLTRDLVLSS